MPSRGRLIGIIVAAIVAVAVIAAAVVYFVPVFKVAAVTVTGNQRLTTESVVEAAAIPEGSNLLRIDAGGAAAGVAENPWVATASVKRQFPDQVVVEVIERKAVAYVNADDGPHLIDDRGQEFVIDTPPEDAVEITGEWTPENLGAPVDIIIALPDDVRGQISDVAVEDEYSYRLWLKDGRNVFWGANADNDNKVLALRTVLGMEGDNWNISNPALVSRP